MAERISRYMKREPVERNGSRRFFNRIKFREEDNKSVNVAKLKWVEKKARQWRSFFRSLKEKQEAVNMRDRY